MLEQACNLRAFQQMNLKKFHFIVNYVVLTSFLISVGCFNNDIVSFLVVLSACSRIGNLNIKIPMIISQKIHAFA